jgi:hypothetical protein
MGGIPARSRAWYYTAPGVHSGGDVGITDQTARSHEMMPKLVAKLDMLTENMRLAGDDGRVLLRSGVKKLVSCMKGRNLMSQNSCSSSGACCLVSIALSRE